MAEVVGLAASIAGLVAITGQIGKSVLFIKGFLEDTKNAPEEIRSLAYEIELLSSAAEKTNALLSKCQDEGLDFDVEDQERNLARYADMIEKLKAKIEKDVKTFGPGKGRWWERIGSAARKKSVEQYLRGVERAKSLVLNIEMKMLIQLQHDHRDSLITANQSLETLRTSSNGHTTTLSTIETRTTQISALTGATNQTLATLTTEVQQINNNFSTLMPAIQNLQQQSTPQPELSALESMLESAVMRSLKRHHEELEKCQPTSLHLPSEALPQTHANTFPQNRDRTFCSESYAMIRRDKRVFHTSFRTLFFDIEIETKEAQRIPKSKKGTSYHEISQLKPRDSQRFTLINVRIKIPFWRGGMTYRSGNAGMMYGGNLCKTFRTYNIVPHDAPVIKACERFDLAEVRRLFQAGLASPMDFDYQWNLSVVDTVVWHLAYRMHEDPEFHSGAAMTLLKYLIYCLNGDIGRTQGVYHLFYFLWDNPEAVDTAAHEEVCRLLLTHCSADPLDYVAKYFSIQTSKTSLYRILVTQDIWWVDDDGGPYDQSLDGARYWEETDFRMLKDPAGNSLKTALKEGAQYMAYIAVYNVSKDDTLHALLTIASNTMEDDFHNCVYSRMVIMIKHGLDPRKLSFVHAWGSIHSLPKGIMSRPMSCTEYAQFLDLGDLWARSLAGAGWTAVDIDDLFEEDLVLATTSLLSGRIEYRTRDDNRREFIQAVRRGEFANLKNSEIWSLSVQSEYELGIPSHIILIMIIETRSFFKTRKTPGSWLDEDDVVLMPGRDFRLPYNHENDEQLKDWQCIRDIWENELGGVIPGGYAGSKYGWRTKQWV